MRITWKNRFYMLRGLGTLLLVLLSLPALGHTSEAAPTATTQALYRAWKARYLKQGTCRTGELYVDSSTDAGEPGDITVSEAHGYGMLLLVAMAPHDPTAHAQFDAMLRLAERHAVAPGQDLMAWRLDAACEHTAGTTSAPDGDLDMAYALLWADARWGSGGAYPYHRLALRRLGAIMDHVVQNADSDAPIMGLWENIAASDAYAGGTRLSDYMMGHFRAFERATYDGRWGQLVKHGYRIMEEVQRQHAGGLLPDFVVVKDGHIAPAPAGYLEGASDGQLGYNACRIPWRLAHDWQVSKDPQARQVLDRLTQGLLRVSDSIPTALVDGYSLAGDPQGDLTGRLAFIAPVAAALQSLEAPSSLVVPWLRAVDAPPTGEQRYYNDTVRLLTMIEWPEDFAPRITGRQFKAHH